MIFRDCDTFYKKLEQTYKNLNKDIKNTLFGPKRRNDSVSTRHELKFRPFIANLARATKNQNENDFFQNKNIKGEVYLNCQSNFSPSVKTGKDHWFCHFKESISYEMIVYNLHMKEKMAKSVNLFWPRLKNVFR